MESISAASAGTNMVNVMLKQSLDQSTQLAEKLIKLNAENIINLNQLEYIGNVIDTYA